MTRSDDRLLDGAPMQPLQCHRCAAGVLVRKASWHQTSVQWNTEAVGACRERQAAAPGDGPNGDRFDACQALRASVREAALNGSIDVLGD